MGITLVSNSVVSGIAAGSGTLNTADAAVGDFAALLSLQALITQTQTPNGNAWLPPLSEKTSASANQLDAPANGEAALATDPALLAAMLGMPPPAAQANSLRPDDVGQPRGSDAPATPLGRTDQLLIDKPLPQQAIKAEPLPAGAPRSAPMHADPGSETANIAGDMLQNAGAAPTMGSAVSDLAPRRHPAENLVQPGIATPLQSKAWPEQFGEKIIWLARSDQQSAQININPPQLGPLQITLHLNGDQANAIFASPHAEVRQAIDAAMPQLRDMLQSAGITLGDASVGANLAQQGRNNPFASSNGKQSGPENAILPANVDPGVAGVGQTALRGNGLVDLFA